MSNEQVLIQFSNGKQVPFAKGVRLTEIAKAVSSSLAKKAVAGSVHY